MSPLTPRSRRLLVAGLVVIALGLILSTVARRALRPAAFRPIAEAQLSQVLGRPVTVGSMDVDLLPRLQVTGGDITMGGGGTGSAPSMQLRTVRIVPRLSSVVSGRLAIDLIEIEGLSLAIRRDAAGNWLLPFASAATPASAPATGSHDKPPGRPAPATTTAEPEALPATAVPAVEVAAVRLTNGRVTLVDDVLRSPTGSSEVAVINDVSARVTIQGGVVHLDQLTAKLGASALTGSGRADGQGVRASLAWSSIHPADLPTVFGLAGVAPVPGLSVEGDRPLDVELAITPGGAVAARGTVRAGRLALDTLQIETVEAPFSFDGRVFTADPLVFHAVRRRREGAVRCDNRATGVVVVRGSPRQYRPERISEREHVREEPVERDRAARGGPPGTHRRGAHRAVACRDNVGPGVSRHDSRLRAAGGHQRNARPLRWRRERHVVRRAVRLAGVRPGEGEHQ